MLRSVGRGAASHADHGVAIRARVAGGPRGGGPCRGMAITLTAGSQSKPGWLAAMADAPS